MPPDDAAYDTTRDRLRRSLEIAGEAYDLPEADRAAFVAEACGDDTALRLAVDDLLAFDERSHSLLDGGVGELFAPPDVDAVGGYRVTEELGRGGMGVVYAAERVDGTFEKSVALKLVQASRASDEAARRFDRERRVLARLDHVGIARLLDGGVTPDGRPYFIMERVDGEPITAYAAAHDLGLDARLALVLDVCDAVAHAHRLLVVHRDLKPSNVFVAEDETGAPRVKLLDFGIAKALDEDDDEDVLTRTGAALTPAYAAPEQVAGEPVTAATDVYALGVMTYELLVGRRPYSFPSRALAEVARVVREAQPTRPSDAVTTTTAPAEAAPAAWSAPPKRLRGDLDAIVLKALRKEPERRYATAGELAADLRRHVEGRPVEARGDSVGYRTSRFVRRHRAGVAAAAALVLALVGGAAAVLWQARETAREAARANATLDYVLGMFEAVDPVELEGGQLRPADLLAPGLRQAAALDGQPLVQASLLEGLGRLGVSLGEFALADSVLTRAVAVRRRVQGPDHPDLAGPLILLARSYTSQREYAPAIEAAEEAVRLAEGDPAIQAEARTVLGDVLYRDNEVPTDTWKTLFRAADVPEATPAVRVAALRGVALGLEESDSLDAALVIYEEATGLARETFGLEDPRTADALYDYAETIRSAGDAARAAALHTEALDIYNRAYGDGDYRTANSLYTLAVLHQTAEEYALAERYYRQSRAAYARSTLDEDHLWRSFVEVGLGGLLLQRGRSEEAVDLLSGAVTDLSEILGPSDLSTLGARLSLSSAYVLLGRGAQALDQLRVVEATMDEDPSTLNLRRRMLTLLAEALSQTGNRSEAADARRRLAELGPGGS